MAELDSFRGTAQTVGGSCCRWNGCNKSINAKSGDKFIVCQDCLHVTCTQCDASHEGMNCKAYRITAGKTESESLVTLDPQTPVVCKDGAAMQSVPLGGVSQEQVAEDDSGNGSSKANPEMAVHAAPKSEPGVDRQEESSPFAGTPVDKLEQESNVEEGELESQTNTYSLEDETSPMKTIAFFECDRCRLLGTRDMVVTRMFCEHKLCRTCIERSVSSSLAYLVRGQVLSESLCSNHNVPETILQQDLPSPTLKLHKELCRLPLISCAAEGCSGKCNIRSEMGTFRCPECGAVNCVSCRAIHSGLSCKDHLTNVIASLDGYSDLYRNGILCGTANCGNVGHLLADGRVSFCVACGEFTCVECGVVHTFETCEEYKAGLLNVANRNPVQILPNVINIPGDEQSNDEEEAG